MKIFAGGIATETNTFCPVPTVHEDFLVQRGCDVLRGRIDHPSLDLSALWGKQAAEQGHQFVFSLNAWAEPAGITRKDAYESLRNELLRDLQAAMPVDVVLLMLHGAMIAQEYEDCEHDIIRRIRDIVGSSAVIGVEFDLHCHLTEAKIALSDVVVTYKEYPHTDINERARELYELATKAKRNEIRPTMAVFDCRMVGFYPTSRQPLRGFVDAMLDAERRGDVLSVSFAHSFPYADLPHVGAKMLVVTDNDPVLAAAMARQFGLRVYALRREIGFDSISLPLHEALTRALASSKQPVVVADQSDNVGAGGPSDATFALRWLLERRVSGVAIAIFYDPQVVQMAKRAGRGARLHVRLGGKLGPSSGDPVEIDATVLEVRENYLHARPQQSGEILWTPIGDAVALRCEGIDIVVGSRRCQCYSPSIFDDMGIDIKRKRVLIAKSTQHFYYGFASIAGEVIYMAAPGAVPPDPRRIAYRRLENDCLYPWIDDPLAR